MQQGLFARRTSLVPWSAPTETFCCCSRDHLPQQASHLQPPVNADTPGADRHDYTNTQWERRKTSVAKTTDSIFGRRHCQLAVAQRVVVISR